VPPAVQTDKQDMDLLRCDYAERDRQALGLTARLTDWSVPCEQKYMISGIARRIE